MNRERAETYLRQLAEAELRSARTLPAARTPGRQITARPCPVPGSASSEVRSSDTGQCFTHMPVVSEFCLCVLMQRSASPFAIGNPPLVSG
jgi:hypothetical protein